MINANDYNSSEELKKAMESEYREQIIDILMSKSKTIQINSKIVDHYAHNDLEEAIAYLDKREIYRLADSIEEYSKAIALSASLIKSATRFLASEED